MKHSPADATDSTGNEPTTVGAAPLALRQEIGDLGRLFGSVIEQFSGRQDFELVEQVRGLSAALRRGDLAAGEDLRALLAKLDERQIKVVIRSFTLFLELANLAEDRHRVRVLRERNAAGQVRDESVQAAVRALRERDLSASQMQTLVDGLAVELVLTAHPTEAKRRSIRRLLRSVRIALSGEEAAADDVGLYTLRHHQLLSWLEILWHTDLIRPWRPTVLQEVERGLAFLPVLWQVAPMISQELRTALAECFPAVRAGSTPPIRFGSWIGGDRDGNPFVTPRVTEETLMLLRRAAIERHHAVCQRLSDVLSVSERQASAHAPLAAAIQAASIAFPEVAKLLEARPPLETFRRWLTVIGWRLERTTAVSLAGRVHNELAGSYLSAEELLADVQLLADALDAAGCRNTLETKIAPWLDQIRIFGFHTSRLDIRQHAGVYRDVMNEILTKIGFASAPELLDEQQRIRLLTISLSSPLPRDAQWSSATAETLELFALLRRVGRRFGMAALGEHVISMTARASDVLTVLWLWRWSEWIDGGDARDADLLLPIVPLFETITDLDRAAATLNEMLAVELYRNHLRGLADRQTVMIGYSDSTKDGGYLAAQWALYRSQIELHSVAERHGVAITFFHGRGGSLGRGGGPAARSILSLPAGTFHGSLRLTEQGEVLAERYDNPHIAHRHLEQVTWSSLIAAAGDSTNVTAEWTELIATLAHEAWVTYREFVEHPMFGEFYRAVTPISLIERLPIGSRPSKRKASSRIEDLRAIPWVFSWTQNRTLLPAWFGMGAAYARVTSARPAAKSQLMDAYRDWPFFTSAIDNAMLALAKANMNVFHHYTRLAEKVEGAANLSHSVVDEFERAKRAILEITKSRELLDNVPWLQQSIQVRNGYVDPLNLVQVELIRRRQQSTFANVEQRAEIEHLASLSVKGIATGMRTTG